MNWNSLMLVLAVSLGALLLRCTISLYGYSGAGKPPMYGDYEAQRHWMEITYNLPIADWYRNTTDNDLQYWGLDYPPLTAYHSWLCGYVANRINSSWVELFNSRGLETKDHKFFMRSTVLAADLLIFFPAVFMFFRNCCKSIPWKLQLVYSLLTLLYPGLMLIDHGHFQFNAVSLGFSLWGLVCILLNHDLLGAIAFVLAINYKQMELYHAMPFFCYLLGSSFRGRELWLWKLIKIGIVTLGTFALCWFPYLHDVESLKEVLHRIFPFARGLYEDKVANVWCTLSIFVKLKELLDFQDLLKLCVSSTLLMLLPSSLHLLIKPTKRNFTISLVNASLVFFLFSFQVHEKSILIPAMSVCTLFPQYPFACMWFLVISVFSMIPLLIRDGLLLPTIASTIIFILITCSLSEGPQASTPGPKHSKQPFVFWPEDIIPTSMFMLSIFGIIMLTFMHLKVQPPPNLPDIYPILIAAYSCAHFGIFLLFFHCQQFFGSPSPTPTRSTKGYSTREMKKYN